MKYLETKLLIDDTALAYFYRYKPQEEKKKNVFCTGIFKYDVCNVTEPLEMPVNTSMGYVLNPVEDQMM